MDAQLNILVLEDSQDDFQLIERHLTQGGRSVRCQRVATLDELTSAARKGGWDVVLADYQVPTLDFQETLAIHQSNLPDVPLILVSGKVGEEKAVELLQLGVWDFVLKDHLARLRPVVERCARDAANRRARQAAEKALRESEGLFSTTFHAIPIPVSISDVTTDRWVEVNQAFLNVTGYTRAEIIGHSFLDLNLWKRPEDRDSMRKLLQSHGRVNDFEVDIIKKSGATGTMLIFVEKVDLAGKPYLLIMGNEITERKRAQEAQQRLSTAIEQAAEVIVITDAKATIQYVNPAFTRLTGYTRDEAIGQNPRVLQSGQHDAAFYRQLWATLTAGQTWHGRFVNKRKDGTLFTEDAVISPVRDATGAIVNYVAVKRDVTRELVLEARLLQAQKLESIGTLASGIAHDLNNILFPLLMGAQWLQEEPLTPAQHDIAKTMESSVMRGAEIIKQILAFARGTSGAKGLLQTKHVIRDVLAMIRETFPRSIKIESHLVSELWPVSGDATQLHQVLLNLCVNARDAMPEGGTLTVRAENRQVDESSAHTVGLPGPGAYVVWTVDDTGEGIPAAILPKIFDPFFTTKALGKGTGLGLSSVHGIVKDHGGAIRVRSVPDKGSTFEVFLPAQAHGAAPAGETETILPQGRGELVLVVDDEASIRETLKAFVKAGGYEVITGRNGVEAIALCEARRAEIKAVVLDMMMPEMGGEAALRIIRKRSPRMPVLAISGMMEGVTLPTDDCTALLMKPFGKSDLLPTLRNLLDRATPPPGKPAPGDA